jgi:hypothetical protein
MAVMAAVGDLEKVDAVLHCDLGWEHQGTYDLGDFYSTWLTKHGVYNEVMNVGNIRELGAKAHVHMPFWTPGNGRGQLKRQCTTHFKVWPQRRRIRELMGFPASKPPQPGPGAVEKWIGFTVDEMHRCADSRVDYIVNRFPLIEKRMSRMDCVAYLQEKGLPLPPPSSCVGCPYKSEARWAATCLSDAEDAIAFDAANRINPLASDGSYVQELYVHRSLMPLGDVLGRQLGLW